MSNKEIKEMFKELETNLKAEIKKLIKSEISYYIKEINEKLSNLSSELKLQNQEIQELKNSQTFINKEFEEIKKSMSITKKHEKELHVSMKINEDKQILTNKKIEKLDLTLENLEQYGRRDNLEFIGVPKHPNENTNQIIKNLVKKLNIKLNDNDISISHRLKSNISSRNQEGINHPPIIVRFTNREIRNQIYKKRNCINQISDFGIPGMEKMYINENLTSYRKLLFNKAKKLQKENDYKYLWTNQCQILTRKNAEENVLKISCFEDLDRMC